MNPAKLLALEPRIIEHRYAARDTILYALGVGAGQEKREDELKFVYEDGLVALPTMAVVLGYPGYWQREPFYEIDWKRVLHVEQSVTFHRPVPATGSVRGEFTIDRIVDKGAGRGALLYAKRRVIGAADGEPLATVMQVSYLRGDGGQGGSDDGTSTPAPIVMPDRAPDAVVAFRTREEQAILYRLSGDLNPVHIDPAVAREVGLREPLLHGLSTYGFAGRAVLRAFCDNDPARLRHLECRFTSPVWPGDPIDVEMWRQGSGEVHFRVRAPARDVIVANHGRAEIG